VVAHIVMFRPRADLSQGQQRDLADALKTAIGSIGSIRRVRVGRRIRHGRPYEFLMRTDYPYVAIFEFADLAGLQAYLDDPAHERLAGRFFESFEETLLYDYELEDGSAAVDRLL
jgi:hypothetical protein